MRQRHDAAGFLAGELERRRALRYPPFSHLVRIELAAPEAEPAAAGRRAGSLTSCGRCFPRTPSCSARRHAFGVRGRDRRQLLIKAGDREPAVAAVRAAVEGLAADRALREASLGVDVDPQ